MTGRQSRYVLVRQALTGIFAFGGLFVLCYGLGSGSQAVLVLGGALLVVAGGTRLWFSGLRRPPRQWLRGTGQVIEVSAPPVEFRYGRCSLRLVVEAPGVVGEQVTVHESRVPVEVWPRPGQLLPLQVAADNIRKVRVLWQEINPVEATASPAATPPVTAIPGETPPEARSATASSASGAPSLTTPIDFDLDDPPGPLTPGAVTPPPRSPAPVESATTPDEPAPTDESAEEEAALAAEEAVPGRPDRDDQPGAAPAEDLPRALPRPRPSPPERAAAASSVTDPADPRDFHSLGVTVLVSDLARSVAFYRDTLGLTEVDSGEEASVLASGATRLVLRQATDLGAVKLRLVHLNLEVDDIDATYAALKADGVRFTYPPRVTNRTTRLEQWAAAFRDPDGHGIALTQWRPVSTSASSA